MLLLPALAALSTLAVAALPPGTVVVGLGDVEGTSTEIVAILPDGRRQTLGLEAHDAGMIPAAALAPHGDTLALAVKEPGAAAARVVVLDLAAGTRRIVGEGAIPGQAPVLDGTALVYVRALEAPERSTFDVVRVADIIDVVDRTRAVEEEIVASTTGAWLAPLRGAPGHFLLVAEDGEHSLVALTSPAGGALEPLVSLGKGRFRSPVVVGRSLWLERASRTGADIVAGTLDGERQVLRRGLPGMDPLLVGGTTSGAAVVFGAGTKRAGVRVLFVDSEGEARKEQLLDGGRAGIATPRAAAMIDDLPVIVAWLSRGHALPGELWLFGQGKPRRLVEPRAGLAVEVYGIVGSPQATTRRGWR